MAANVLPELYAWVVVLFGGKEASHYANGVIALKQSMINVGSQYPLICLMTEDIPQNIADTLQSFGIKVIRIPYITADLTLKTQKQYHIYGSWIKNACTKWTILNPKIMCDHRGRPYDKVYLLDADSLMMENCDSLFELEAPAMTFGSPWGFPHLGTQGSYGNPEHGDRISADAVKRGLACSFVGLACGVLASPNQAYFDRLLKLLAAPKLYLNKKCISGPDEQILARVFLEEGVTEFTHVSSRYNSIVGKTDWQPDPPIIMQWYNDKPWYPAQEWDDIKIWKAVWDQTGMTLIKPPKHKR